MCTSSSDADATCAVGVDIGRSKIAVAVVDASGHVTNKRQIAAPPADEPFRVAQAVIELARALQESNPDVAAMGVGTPEPLEWPEGVVVAGVDGRKKFPLRACLQDATGLPTVVDSDANVATWAEARLGAAVGKRNVVMLTVGTGVGGGFVLDGRMYRGSRGMAGEVGHLLMTPYSSERCSCGNEGCLESLASGTALGRSGRRTAAQEPDGLIATLAGSPDLVTGETVYRTAVEGDPKAIALFERLGFWLGRGIASLILVFDPDIVVIGGGLVRTGELLLAPTRLSVGRNVLVWDDSIPPIVKAKYLSNAGVVGAAVLALDSLRPMSATGICLRNGKDPSLVANAEERLQVHDSQMADIAKIISDAHRLPSLPSAFRPKIGIIGCGSIVTEAHIPVYQRYNLPVAGVFDADEATAQSVAREYGIAKVYRSSEELLSDPAVEVVDVATHPDVRVDLICAALDAGKHVFAQKPLATDMSGAHRVVGKTAASDRKVAINQNARWAPPWYVATKFIEMGIIGDILSVTMLQNSNFSYITGTRFDEDLNFSIYDYSIHWIDIICCWCAGLSLKEIRAMQYRLPTQPSKSKTPWAHWIDISYENGVTALIRGAGAAAPEVQGHPFWIHGEHGTVRGSVRHREFIELETDGISQRYSFKGGWYLEGFAGAIGELLSAIDEDREPYNSPGNNLLTLQMTLAACTSANSSGLAVSPADLSSFGLCTREG